MIDALIARTRFYDITGYLIPGELLLGIVWLYMKVFGWGSYADRAMAFVSDHWMTSLVLIFLAGAYAVGHMANSLSKILFERLLFKQAYEVNSNWFSRVQSDSTGRGSKILDRFKEEFGYEATNDNKPSTVIQGWAEQVLPAPSLTTFRFLCFYGMNRTFMLLNLLLIPPVSHWTLLHSHFCCMAGVIVAGLITSGLFGYQYLRFVKSYSDSIPELLLMKQEKEPKK